MTLHPTPLSSWPVSLSILAATAALTLPANAIQPERWVHSTEADFEAGTMGSVVATNLGDLKLANATQPTIELPESVSAVYDVVQIGPAFILATGPQGKLLKVQDGQVTELAAFPDQQVFTLMHQPNSNRLTVGISGEAGSFIRQLQINEDAVETVREVALPDVRYVWDLASRSDREQLIVSTGTEGKIFAVSLDGQVSQLLDTSQANVLCLAQGNTGEIYAGTDTDGLIYRLDQDDNAFVVYDAAEPEIGTLLLAADGNLYAGTADAEQSKPGRMTAAVGQETGRPEIAPVAEIASPAEPLPDEPQPQPLAADVSQQPHQPADGSGSDSQTSTSAEADGPAIEDAQNQAEDSATPTSQDLATPSPEQLDALREEVRRRLLAARDGGVLPSNQLNDDRPTRKAQAAARGDKSGNAVYRIDPRGFVSEVFRESVMVLDLAERPDGRLLVSTGSEGQLYLVDTQAGETSVLADLESQQLTAVVSDGEKVLVAGANPASLIDLVPSVETTGVYTSDVLDASQVSLWGKLRLVAELPEGSSVTVETRSGNVADPEIAPWSAWSAAASIEPSPDQPALEPREIEVSAPPARFLQYRLRLQATESSPVVGRVEIAYVVPNLRPAIASLSADYPPYAGIGKPSSPNASVKWAATDDNGDRLLYRLDYQPATGDTVNAWLPLAKELTETNFDWDTRQLPDGRYRLRLSVSDRLDNPGDMALEAGRLADPITIDNTPPAAVDLNVATSGNSVTLSGRAVDALTPILSISYSVDAEKLYTPILPEDLIYDSTDESWSATILDLAPGGHAVTVRMIDQRGNTAYASKLFEINP